MLEQFKEQLQEHCHSFIESLSLHNDELTLFTTLGSVKTLLKILRDDKNFKMEQLIDLCAVDYSDYGHSEWQTSEATVEGFSRARVKEKPDVLKNKRFAVVYHLLSITHNQRLRVKLLCDEGDIVPSSFDIWPCANWFEREAYDLYGIFFDGHPDMRRLLTDYGFIGHPFRKDFPISGHVEMRYDATAGRVVYEPVDIEPRTLVPKVIRNDSVNT